MNLEVEATDQIPVWRTTATRREPIEPAEPTRPYGDLRCFDEGFVPPVERVLPPVSTAGLPSPVVIEDLPSWALSDSTDVPDVAVCPDCGDALTPGVSCAACHSPLPAEDVTFTAETIDTGLAPPRWGSLLRHAASIHTPTPEPIELGEIVHVCSSHPEREVSASDGDAWAWRIYRDPVAVVFRPGGGVTPVERVCCPQCVGTLPAEVLLELKPLFP